MKNPATTNILLLVIAVALIAIALKPLRQPPPARAQTQNLAPLYIEPGTQLIRAPDGSQNVYGKMVVDLSDRPNLGISYPQRRAVSGRHIHHKTARVPCHLPGNVRF